jgi:GR25 family glycosyltransferase involved in LPS biosynthesis
MSSFTQNKTIQCEYCKEKYIKYSFGYQCLYCRLWQPSTPYSILTQKTKWDKKKIQYIYVISLEKDISRWNLFLKRLTICNLEKRKLFRFLGVDGSNPYELKLSADIAFNKKFTSHKICEEDIQKKIPGSIGCYLSHLSLWETLLTNHSHKEHILIMEDDAYFTPAGIQNIDIVLSQIISIDWDILYVGHNHLRGDKIHPLLVKPRPPKKGEPIQGYNTGFFGYIVKISSLPKLIQSAKEMKQPYIDLQIRDSFEKTKLIKAFFLIPNLIQHNKNYTSTRRNYDKR